MFQSANTFRFAIAYVLAVLLSCSLPMVATAQQSDRVDRRTRQLFEESMLHLRQGAYDQAITGLSQAISRDSNYAEAHQALADLYRKQAAYAAAARHYQRVLALNPDLTPTTLFGLGESLLHTGRYQEALEALNLYEARFPNEPDRTKLSRKYIQDCRFSLAYFAAFDRDTTLSTAAANPINFGKAVNTHQDEYFPKLTADRQTMIFTRKSDSKENFFQSTVDSDGTWQTATLLRGDINSRHFNEGAHCISPDGKYLYFTGCNRPDGLGSCDIYVSRWENGHWGTPHNLGPTINTRGWEAQPALSADGRTLYFVSNRAGGEGGYDIWKAQLDEDGNWGIPTNLGPKINTPFDESAPFIHADNQTLYFTSNGWPGFGDKDIFRSHRDSTGQWGTPVNMGSPINDHTEQSAWTVSMNGEQAYFASRTGSGEGGLDIYWVDLPHALRPARVAYLQGLVTDAQSGLPLPGALVRIADVATATQTYSGVADEVDGSFLAPMTFGKTYALHITHPGYLLHSRTYALDDSASFRQDAYQLVVALLPAKPGHTEVLQNVFFETGKYELLAESRTELAQLFDFLQSNPDLEIEIGGHTDSTGGAEANQRLSEQRANAVRDHLIELGIAPHRIRAVGYGQYQPIASNTTAEGRRQNRRTDFRIVER